jgi:hypothetical protein
MSKLFNKLFTMPNADTLAKQELQDAQRGLLEAQKQADYFTAMANFYQTRINKLSQPRSQHETTTSTDI